MSLGREASLRLIKLRGASPSLGTCHGCSRPQRPREESFVTMCGWCKRVAVSPRRWLEVEEAIAALALFDEPRPPQLTHGVCEECSESLLAMLKGRQDNPVFGGL